MPNSWTTCCYRPNPYRRIRAATNDYASTMLCFLLGCITGSRSLIAPALVCWAAHLGWLHFSDTKLAFIGTSWTLTLFTLLAFIELIADKLPGTPARTAPVGLIARIVLGGASGVHLRSARERACRLRRLSVSLVPSSGHMPATNSSCFDFAAAAAGLRRRAGRRHGCDGGGLLIVSRF
jgi:hypothetical protein